jgi:putative Holliday junction resolvase
MTFRRGVRVGVDVGTVRIGLARCDADGILATPLPAVRRGPGDVAAIAAVVGEYEASEVIVGLPVSLDGTEKAAAAAAADFAAGLAAKLAVPVRLVDERLSTVQAQRTLHSAGRDTRSSRSVIDSAAATLIVQSAVDFEKSTGEPPGRMVTKP